MVDCIVGWIINVCYIIGVDGDEFVGGCGVGESDVCCECCVGKV